MIPRFFAIIPAAGHSVRMGQPKLLLPWGDKTVIEAVLKAWREGGVTRAVMTVRPDDEELARLGRAAGAEVVVVSPPPVDMKASALAGLEYVAENYAPQMFDAWLLAPADMPLLSPQVIQRLLAEWRASPVDAAQIIAPVCNGRRGHPVLFGWPLAAAARQLGEAEGLNRLLAQFEVDEAPVGDEAGFVDLDTPEEYRRWQPPPPPR